MAKSKTPANLPFFNGKYQIALDDLDQLASTRIVRRGLGYAKSGRVVELSASPRRLEAKVTGSESMPYLVTVFHDGEELVNNCNCPFDWEPFCKHGIAVLAAHFDLVEQAPQGKNLSEVERKEISVRHRRAKSDNLKVRKQEGGRFLGRYLVSSGDKKYDVEIRSLAETINRCSCPDYATSMLGTCKHIEAVLFFLRKRAPRKFAAAAGESPEIGYVLADYSDQPRIRLVMPGNPTPALQQLARGFFDSQGYFFKDPVIDFPRFLQEGKRLRKLIIFDDAIELAEVFRTETEDRKREEDVRRDVLRGGSKPGNLKAKLYPYQLAGTAFLASAGRALLGDEMGLGKTIQAIAAAGILTSRNEITRTLVICPASLKEQWASEIRRFTHLDCQVVGGSPEHRLRQYRLAKTFTIINYELALRDQKEISALAPGLMILDEAQRIKNWRTKTATAIKDIKTRFVFALTGTPLQNRLDDLYSILQVVDKRILGPLWAYNEKFVVRNENGTRIEGYKNLNELRLRISQRVLRRTLADVKLQLPERIDSRFAVGMTQSQQGFMAEAVSLAGMYANIARKRPLSPQELERMMMAMQRARMSCNAAGLVDKESQGSPKLDEFAQLINDLCLGENRKVVVFSEWVKFCGMAAECADDLGIGYVRLDGQVPSHKRGALIDKFRNDQDCHIFFSTDAGGVGLNLQFASALINLEMPWNPAVLDQRIGRVHRHGQTDPVHVFLMVAENSFESSLENTLACKREIFSAVLDVDSDVLQVDAPTSCLQAVEATLDDMGIEYLDSSDEDDEIAAQEIDSFHLDTSEKNLSPTGKQPPTDSGVPELDPTHLAISLANLLGSRLHQVMELPSGQLVALVDKVDEMTTEAAVEHNMTIAAASLLESMAVLGDDSPFASSRPLITGGKSRDFLQKEQSRRWLEVANRKLKAARMLVTSDLGAEAMTQASSCLLATACAAAGEVKIDEKKPSMQLLFEVLVPQKILDLEQAAVISRAEGLAASYASSSVQPDEATVQMVLVDAEMMLNWANNNLEV